MFFLVYRTNCFLLYINLMRCLQMGGDLDGKLDENTASLMLDTTPSKIVSSELTVSFFISNILLNKLNLP